MTASRRLYEEVFGRGNFDVADDILSPEVINHGASDPPTTGPDQIKRQAARLRSAFPDLTVTLEDQFASGDRVCSRWSAAGTHTVALPTPNGPLPPTGNAIGFQEIRIDRYVDGRIIESWFIPDRFALWQALGLIPASAGAR